MNGSIDSLYSSKKIILFFIKKSKIAFRACVSMKHADTSTTEILSTIKGEKSSDMGYDSFRMVRECVVSNG